MMLNLKLLYTCVAIAFAPPPAAANAFKESLEQIYCGRSSNYEQCQRMGRAALSRTMNRWAAWGYRSEIDDFEIVCEASYFEVSRI